MAGDQTAFRRFLVRDTGGLPLWGVALAAAVVLGGAAGVASGALSPTPPPPYVAPSDALTPSIPSPMPLAVFLGDSYTQGAGGEGVRWPTLVADHYGWDSENLGLGGTGYLATSGVAGCGRSYCGTYLETSSQIVGNPRFIIVAGGRNDLDRSVSEIGAAAGALFASLTARYPAATIVTIAPWYDDDVAPRKLVDAGEAIGRAAKHNGVIYVSTGLILEGRPDLLSDDGVHPNPAGYRVLSDAVISALDSALTL